MYFGFAIVLIVHRSKGSTASFQFFSPLYMHIYSLHTWCGLNLDTRALFWVFATHRSQNIYNCLWLHCFLFICPIDECLNDSSMFFRSNDRPTPLFSPLVDIYVYLCNGYIWLSLLFVSVHHHLWSFSFSVVASSAEIWFALGCNMSIKHDARILVFFSSQFPCSHLLIPECFHLFVGNHTFEFGSISLFVSHNTTDQNTVLL